MSDPCRPTMTVSILASINRSWPPSRPTSPARPRLREYRGSGENPAIGLFTGWYRAAEAEHRVRAAGQIVNGVGAEETGDGKMPRGLQDRRQPTRTSRRAALISTKLLRLPTRGALGNGIVALFPSGRPLLL